MPPRDIRAYLTDIRESIAEIENAVAGLRLEDYEATRAVRSRVEREFMIVGEALRQLLGLHETFESRVTAATSIVGFRNHLAHGYFLIAHATVWDIIHGHLPVLKQEIQSLANEYS